MRRLRRAFVGLALTGVLLAVLLTFVFPTRSFLAQRASITDARQQLRVLDQQNDQLAARAAQLRDDAEIERIAREQYNLVRPGEEAYAVLPPPGASEAPTATSVPPPDENHDKGLLAKAWDKITSLF
ncbi:MAG: septum formation initiator family protein [Acidobacteria bacterium]|nr:septum formation initiator family protein [Acidobacteriota bacterium]